MTDKILKLNEHNELVAKDPETGEQEPVAFEEVDIRAVHQTWLINNPQKLPLSELEDGDSIELGVLVEDGESLEVYRWGAYDAGNEEAPTGLDVELLDGDDTVQASANTVDESDVENPVASYENTSGSVSAFKLRAKNESGGTIPSEEGEPGVATHFGYRVV